MLLIDPDEMLRHVPGRMWLDVPGQAASELSVRGFHFAPGTSQVTTANHVLIVYRQRRATMRRRIDGRMQDCEVGPGDISLKNFDSVCDWAWPDQIDVIHVYLQPGLLDRVAGDIHGPGFSRFRLNDCVRLRDDRITGIVSALVDEAEARRAGYRTMARALGLQLAVHLVREHGGVSSSLPSGGFDEAECRRISSHIATHLSGDLSVAALARLAGLSTDHFSRRFRAAFGCAPHQYVLRTRLEAACEMLRDPHRQMADVAAESGFADQSHFSRWFKREFGQPPGIWRRERAATAS